METSELDKLLKFLLETLQEGKGFALDEAPQFVRELLAWRLAEAEILIAVGVGFLLIGWTLCALMHRSDDEDFHFYGNALALVGSVCGLGFIIVNTMTAVQVTVAPRLVLVQMVRELLK